MMKRLQKGVFDIMIANLIRAARCGHKIINGNNVRLLTRNIPAGEDSIDVMMQ